MKGDTNDTIVSLDKTGRRRFLRTGSAFLLASGSSVAGAQQQSPARSDCDSTGNASSKNPEAASSDSDTGSNADRQGCGTNKVPITYRVGRTKYT